MFLCLGTIMPSRDWPDRGDIIYQEVSARYARELDPVLQDISVHMKAGEKVRGCKTSRYSRKKLLSQ